MGFLFARSKSRNATLLATLAAITFLTLSVPALAVAEGAFAEVAETAPCQPADRSTAIDQISVIPTVVSLKGLVDVNFSGSLPEGGCNGDHISIQLPNELSGLSGSFPMKSPTGTVIATMAVTSQQVVITFNDFIETHDHVVFKGFFNSRIADSVKPGTEYILEWTVGETLIKTPLTTQPCKECEVPAVEARKFAVYQDGTPPFVQFSISTAATQTADETISITDAVSSGQALDCDSIRMRVGDSVTDRGTLEWDGPWHSFDVQSCSESGVTVTLKASQVGQFFLLTGRSAVTSVQTAYVDEGTVKQHGAVTNLPATARVSDGGGTAEGVIRAPKVDIEKWSTNQDPKTGDYDRHSKVLDPAMAESITLTVTNTGSERLREVTVGDSTTAGSGTIRDLTCDFSALGGPASGTAWAGPFEVGTTFDCTGTLPALGFGATHSNSASVAANGQKTDGPVTDSDPWNAHTPPQPESVVDIEKWSTVDGSTAGDFDEVAKSVEMGAQPKLSFTITNTGEENLVNLKVTDKTIRGSAELKDLTCDFSPLGGPSSGTAWLGPFKVGESFECSGKLTALPSDQGHRDRATVVATGADSGQVVTDSDDWNAVVQPDLPSTRQPDVPPTFQADDPGQSALPATGSSGAMLPLGLVGMLMIALGIGVLRTGRSA